MDGSDMNDNSDTVLTIGHSNHPLETFTGLLAQHGVTALADVRSVPWSRFNPQFNKKSLATALKASGIQYVYLGHELGGRSNDPGCYEGGRIRYDRLAQTDRFREGIERVMRGIRKYHLIALMCSEKEPLDCHRTLLVAQSLVERGVDIKHILPDSQLELHAITMQRLIARFDFEPKQHDLLRQQQSHAELIAEAVSRQAGRVAHVINSPAAISERQNR